MSGEGSAREARIYLPKREVLENGIPKNGIRLRTSVSRRHQTLGVVITLLFAVLIFALSNASGPTLPVAPRGNSSAESTLNASVSTPVLTPDRHDPSDPNMYAAGDRPSDDRPGRETALPSLTPGTFRNTYSWSYGDDHWVSTLTIPYDAYQYYRNKTHNRERDYAQYALSDYDRTYLQEIVATFREAGKEKGYSEYDIIMNVAAFVQSLPYTSDSVTPGYDEYPRSPLETLVDNGGDCEDSAILTAALLREMEIDAVLIELGSHMAVGVMSTEDLPGTYYDYQCSHYYYLETTGSGWEIGVVPEAYRQYETVSLYPMIQIPRMEMAFTANLADYNNVYAYYRVHCTVVNIGSGTARDPRIYIAAGAASDERGDIWPPDHSIDLEDYSEGSTGWAEATVRIPRGAISQIVCRLSGDNFAPIEVHSEPFTP